MHDFTIRKMQLADVEAIVDIDALHSGEAKPQYWRQRLAPLFAAKEGENQPVGYAAISGGRVIGYILAEARAWEFGSPPCGWILAIGVHPEFSRRGVALALCREVCWYFKKAGIRLVRTMVRKDDIAVLSFFRASGFHAGPFIELELAL